MRILDTNRRRYRKKLFSKDKAGTFLTGPCSFCAKKIIAKQVCASFTFRYWNVVANLYPYMDGNLMLVPARHVETLEELTEAEKIEWFTVMKETKDTLAALFDTSSFNISLNLGECSGGSIKHLHWQIIPRPYNYKMNAINIFEQITVVGLSPKELVKMIDDYRSKENRPKQKKGG